MLNVDCRTCSQSTNLKCINWKMERESIEVDFEPEETEQGGAGESDAGAGGEDEPRADVMLGVVWQRRANSARLGAAWIVDDEIHCAELEEHAPHFEQLKQLKLTVDPSVMIAPSSSDVQLLEQLALDPVSGAEEHFMVQLLKPADCTVEAARRALGFLRTADCPSDLPNGKRARSPSTRAALRGFTRLAVLPPRATSRAPGELSLHQAA